MTAFDDRLETGRLGERLLDQYLRQKGYIPYYPPKDGAHPFDRLVAWPDKRQLCIAEVKTKPRRNAYEDTGINQCHFEDYQAVTQRYSIPLFLAFVDGMLGRMYGNWWHELLIPRDPDLMAICGGCRGYPWHSGGIVYFPLAAMRTLYVLTDAERLELNQRRQTAWR